MLLGFSKKDKATATVGYSPLLQTIKIPPAGNAAKKTNKMNE